MIDELCRIIVVQIKFLNGAVAFVHKAISCTDFSCEPDTHTLVQWQNAVQMSRFVNIRRRQQLMYNVALGL